MPLLKPRALEKQAEVSQLLSRLDILAGELTGFIGGNRRFSAQGAVERAEADVESAADYYALLVAPAERDEFSVLFKERFGRELATDKLLPFLEAAKSRLTPAMCSEINNQVLGRGIPKFVVAEKSSPSALEPEAKVKIRSEAHFVEMLQDINPALDLPKDLSACLIRDLLQDEWAYHQLWTQIEIECGVVFPRAFSWESITTLQSLIDFVGELHRKRWANS